MSEPRSADGWEFSPEQIELAQSPEAAGMGFDRLGRMATMQAFYRAAAEHPVALKANVNSGLDIDAEAMRQDWIHEARGKARRSLNDFGERIKTGLSIEDPGNEFHDFLRNPNTREKIIANFATPNATGREVMLAVLTDLIAKPPLDLPLSGVGSRGRDRQRALTQELEGLLTFGQAYHHKAVVDTPADDNSIGERLVYVPVMYKKEIRDLFIDMIGDERYAKKLISMFATHFGNALASPQLVKPLQTVSMDTRAPEDLQKVAEKLFTEWFLDTVTYRIASQFPGFVPQRHAWDLEPLAENSASLMVVKNPPAATAEPAFRDFKEMVPAIIARRGYVSFVPAAVLHEGEEVSVRFGSLAKNSGYACLINDWGREHGMDATQKYYVEDLLEAGVNSYEREIFRHGVGGVERDDKKPESLYVLSFRKPKRSLAERVAQIRSREDQAED